MCSVLLNPHRDSMPDYELTAKQGADTMAYIALLEEKLRPALVGPSAIHLLTEVTFLILILIIL